MNMNNWDGHFGYRLIQRQEDGAIIEQCLNCGEARRRGVVIQEADSLIAEPMLDDIPPKILCVTRVQGATIVA